MKTLLSLAIVVALVCTLTGGTWSGNLLSSPWRPITTSSNSRAQPRIVTIENSEPSSHAGSGFVPKTKQQYQYDQLSLIHPMSFHNREDWENSPYAPSKMLLAKQQRQSQSQGRYSSSTFESSQTKTSGKSPTWFDSFFSTPLSSPGRNDWNSYPYGYRRRPLARNCMFYPSDCYTGTSSFSGSQQRYYPTLTQNRYPVFYPSDLPSPPVYYLLFLVDPTQVAKPSQKKNEKSQTSVSVPLKHKETLKEQTTLVASTTVKVGPMKPELTKKENGASQVNTTDEMEGTKTIQKDETGSTENELEDENFNDGNTNEQGIEKKDRSDLELEETDVATTEHEEILNDEVETTTVVVDNA